MCCFLFTYKIQFKSIYAIEMAHKLLLLFGIIRLFSHKDVKNLTISCEYQICHLCAMNRSALNTTLIEKEACSCSVMNVNFFEGFELYWNWNGIDFEGGRCLEWDFFLALHINGILRLLCGKWTEWGLKIGNLRWFRVNLVQRSIEMAFWAEFVGIWVVELENSARFARKIKYFTISVEYSAKFAYFYRITNKISQFFPNIQRNLPKKPQNINSTK